MSWSVERRGGQSNHKWRVLLKTDNVAEAIDTYHRVLKSLRRGGVRIYLVKSDKEKYMIAGQWAPRFWLRTKW